MWHDITRNFKSALRHLTHPPATLLMFVTGYAALILTLYLFLTTREATWWQILLTSIFALLAPYLFAALQTMGVRVSPREAMINDTASDVKNNAGRVPPGELLGGGLRRAWRVLLACVPIILIAWLGVYLLNSLDAKLTGDALSEVEIAARANTATSGEVDWRDALVTTLRVLVLGAIVPLIAVHLWAGVTNAGWATTMRHLFKIVASAFMPAALLTYTLGASLFILVPYLLITTRTPVAGAWLELTLLGVRLMFAFLFFVFGWTLTQNALSRLMINRIDLFTSHNTSHETPDTFKPRVENTATPVEEATPHAEEKLNALPTNPPLLREA
ncbi:MAG: hypothetical protein MSG64_16860 [Pyrinomonadaceae bacterium MAG19_C2-C3]|nr:hypothetical protein [Pyrinomonadaceae bacterium MAG19_C2-C3]